MVQLDVATQLRFLIDATTSLLLFCEKKINFNVFYYRFRQTPFCTKSNFIFRQKMQDRKVLSSVTVEKEYCINLSAKFASSSKAEFRKKVLQSFIAYYNISMLVRTKALVLC